MKWEHSAGIIPFTHKQGCRTYLLLQSALTKSEHWEFPKGLIEANEDAQQAANREFQEETGIPSVQLVPGFKKTLKYFYRRDGDLVGKTVIYFLGKATSTKVSLSSESKAYAWLLYEEALERIQHKSLRDLLKEAEAVLCKK